DHLSDKLVNTAAKQQPIRAQFRLTEDTNHQCTESAACTMYGERASRVINFDPFKQVVGEDDQDARETADDQGCPGSDKGAASGDTHQTSQRTVQRRRQIPLT